KLPVDLRMGRVPDEAHRPVEVAKQIIAAEEALAGEQGQQRVLERHGFPLDSMCGVTLCASEHYVSDCIRRCAHIEPRRGCGQGRWRLRDAGFGETVMTTYDSGARSISGSSKRSRGVMLAGSLLAAASPAHALTVLTAAKVGHFDSGATQPPSAFVRVTNDAGLARLTDPRC